MMFKRNSSLFGNRGTGKSGDSVSISPLPPVCGKSTGKSGDREIGGQCIHFPTPTSLCMAGLGACAVQMHLATDHRLGCQMAGFEKPGRPRPFVQTVPRFCQRGWLVHVILICNWVHGSTLPLPPKSTANRRTVPHFNLQTIGVRKSNQYGDVDFDTVLF